MLHIVAVESGSSLGVYRVKLDDGSSLTINTAYMPPDYAGAFFCPAAETPLDEAAVLALRSAAACTAAEEAALRLVARAEQSFAGLSRKLEQRKHSAEAAAAVLSRLVDMDLVNDGRYAGLWLKSRVLRGSKSPRTLLAALQSKGIDRRTAKKALDASLLPEIELALLRRFAVKALCRIDSRVRGRNGGDTLRYIFRVEGFSPEAVQLYYEEEESCRDER